MFWPGRQDPLRRNVKDVDGWKTVECIFDSGASESVCPASMAPAWLVEDRTGSLVGLHFVSASGSRIPNRGKQRLPIELGDGTRTHAIVQVADEFRPFVSVAKLAEAGQEVIFGCSGGVIRDMASGVDIPFEEGAGLMRDLTIRSLAWCPSFSPFKVRVLPV